jgi:RNA 2',3'-cyclic 3'-phosphodiesterase
MSVQRLFFALWPDPEVRAALARADEQLPRRLGRRVAIENYHITLVFLGSVNAEQRPVLEEAAATVNACQFELDLRRFGHWPGPRVIWLAPAHMPPELLSLAYGLRSAAGKCGLQPDQRPYEAHMTLRRKVLRPPPRWPVIGTIRWRVRRFALVASETNETGPVYTVLQDWSLCPVHTGS